MPRPFTGIIRLLRQGYYYLTFNHFNVIFCFNRMLHIITARTTKPWLANDYIFPLTPTGREHDRLLTILHGFINDVSEVLKP